jgi:hypothetical protein
MKFSMDFANARRCALPPTIHDLQEKETKRANSSQLKGDNVSKQ